MDNLGFISMPAAPFAVSAELPLLFVDDVGVEAVTGVRRAIHAAVSDPAPVLEPEKPWEGGRLYLYGSVYPHAGGYRMWYSSCSTLAQGSDHVLIADSADGVRWTKPSLGITPFEGSADNNIVFPLHSPSVLFDHFEPDPARRYKMLGNQKDGTHKGYDAAFSPDGLHWTPHPANPVFESSDTITLSQDPRTGEYLAYHKKMPTIRGFKRRTVWLSRSRDFNTWSPPELVFGADEEDDAWCRTPTDRTEVYNMAVIPHAAGFIGLPTMFRVISEVPRTAVLPGQSHLDGPIDVQLATSADGTTWRRTTPRTPVIALGEPGMYNGGAILGTSSTAVHTASETWVYYTALNTGHGRPIPPKRLTIGRAVWRRHGFASLDGTGEVVTKPLKLADDLTVNADATGGEVRVELREDDGRPIAGFTFGDSIPLTADNTTWRASWKHGSKVPINRPIRVAVRLSNARLYSLCD